jgi:hypothetical protein
LLADFKAKVYYGIWEIGVKINIFD